MSAIAIVSPGFPEVPGGVTDHTSRVVRHWRDAGRVVHLQGSLGEEPEAVAKRWRAEGVNAVLLQYVPFLYGRRGLSLFPGAIGRAVKALGLRLTVYVHEPWVPPTRLPWLVLSPLQRSQLRRLVSLSDAVVTPVPAWATMLRHDAHVVRVGSTLGEPPVQQSIGEPLPAPVVFSPFAAGLLWRPIAAAAEQIGAVPPLIVIGADAEEARRHPAVGRWYREDWDCRGRLDASEVLSLLSRARVVLAPFVDGLTGRRTSAMASLSTGTRMVSSAGDLYDPFFDESPVAISHSEQEFVQLALDAWNSGEHTAERGARRAWYQRHLDARTLDRSLLEIVSP